MHMPLADIIQTDAVSQESETVASIATTLEGGILINDMQRGEHWLITASELWEAYQAMRDKTSEFELNHPEED